ncbi:hypothetical protein [Phaeobacter italicus]|jgi:dihydroorotase|uniref:Uncharacterized protein n=1 Tax=Phaeobacter italicus TaxID=481446 RepID=A0A0H5D2D0_9RHOB|nr:hypothetical protein [Phaeobacter italicus]EEB70929.1 conserved hypothetical protein [Ruegeria sp. R11]MEC8014416.1 hypothetical protein [Pseudomonadota bacterium]MBO9440829.1 hypothetical protein [Phaeobacter italicus]MBY5975579.1 hypothetical protein [Phaeobacter italicus]MBY6042717.1 hypothetical protein [Phaeobacter italicus]
MPVQTACRSWFDRMPRIKQRFPHLETRQAPSLLDDKDKFVAYLARTHHLTLNEAREEVDDFLYTESLHRELERQVS